MVNIDSVIIYVLKYNLYDMCRLYFCLLESYDSQIRENQLR